MRNPKLSFFHPLVFYPLAGLAVFAPCLLGGNAYFDSDLLTQYVPMRLYLKSCLAHGHFPLWCPYLLGGQPFFADPNTMSAYPFTYLLLPLPVPYGFSLFYLLHFLLGACGMYFWARTLGLSKESGLFAGLLFAFSGFFWWEIIHPPLLAAFAWMPWWGMALEKLSRKLEPAWAFAAGLVFALLFLAGNFQMTLGALYGGGIYLAYRLWTKRDWGKEPQKDIRLLGLPLVFLWGALPLLLLWIPAREFIDLSERFHIAPDYETFQADLSLNPHDLLGFFFPVRPFEGPTPLPVGNYLVNAGYLGPWALFLSAIALGQKKGITRLFAVTGVAAVLTAFGKYFPLHRLLCFLAPGFGMMRAPFRYLFLYAVSGALLAGFGHEFLNKKWRNKAQGSFRKKALLGAALYGVVFLALGFWVGKDVWLQLPAFLAAPVGLYLMLGKDASREMGHKILLLFVTFSFLLTAWFCGSSRWGPPSNFNYSDRLPVLPKLKQQAGLGRVLLGDHIPYPIESAGHRVLSDLPPDSVYAAGIRDAIGYNPLTLDKTSDLYTLGLETYARLMAVKAFAAGDSRWKLTGFSTIESDGVLYGLNQDKIQYAYCPSSVETIADDQKRLAEMRAPGFNPYEKAYFSETIPDSAKENGIGAGLEYGLVRDDPDEQGFKVSLNRSGWVVFSEVMYPGWKAWVDGNPSALYTANHDFRAVWVPAGTHEVWFRYQPVWWKPLLWGLVLWLLSVAGAVAGPWRKKFWEELKNEGRRPAKITA